MDLKFIFLITFLFCINKKINKIFIMALISHEQISSPTVSDLFSRGYVRLGSPIKVNIIYEIPFFSLINPRHIFVL